MSWEGNHSSAASPVQKQPTGLRKESNITNAVQLNTKALISQYSNTLNFSFLFRTVESLSRLCTHVKIKSERLLLALECVS